MADIDRFWTVSVSDSTTARQSLGSHLGKALTEKQRAGFLHLADQGVEVPVVMFLQNDHKLLVDVRIVLDIPGNSCD